MLYFYKSISPHPIENLHKYLHHFFTQLFAEVNPTYDRAHHIHADFQLIIDAYTEQIDNRLLAVFNAYMGLQPNEKQIVQEAYKNNNDVEGVCNKTVKPIKFTELPVATIAPLKGLYDSNGVLYSMLTSKTGYQTIKDKCENLKAHFVKFREANKYSVCSFCGMENLLTVHDNSKNEYDHYISKGDYPFCSINFNNLAPICDYCNKGGNKGQKDIPFVPKSNPQVQEELYYPYSTTFPDHEIVLKINSANTDLSNINSWTLSIDCIPAQNIKRKERWMEIYNIESRYKSKIADDSYQWKERIISKHSLRCKKKGDTFEQFKEDILDDFSEYKKWNNGIHMKTFDEFIMNDPNCESYLTGKFVL